MREKEFKREKIETYLRGFAMCNVKLKKKYYLLKSVVGNQTTG